MKFLDALRTVTQGIKSWAENKFVNKSDVTYANLPDKPTLGTLSAKDTVAKTDLDSDVQASLTKADTAQTRADEAYTLAESKVDSLSDLGITATATELNYVDGVTSNIQTQLDKKAGKIVAGQSFTVNGSSVIAGNGAEVFNDCFVNKATGQHSHAEGYYTTASGDWSHAGGRDTVASGNYSHAEGYNTTASGHYSHVEGFKTTASNNHSHAEGRFTRASGTDSHAEGDNSVAFGSGSHAEGGGANTPFNATIEANSNTIIVNDLNDFFVGGIILYQGNCAKITSINTNDNSITLDKILSSETKVNASLSRQNCVAYGDYSHTEGLCTTASGYYSHAEGCFTVASGANQHAQGKYNISNSNLAHIVGNGNSDTERSNAHTLNWSGNAYYAGSMTSNGADYAELFEWADGNPDNEDRRGRFVTLDGEKIRFATDTDDYILGVVSAAPAVLGDRDDCWQGRWVTDVFGERLTKEYVTVDKETGEERTNTWWIENPEYDSSVEYIPREDRKEWTKVGMVGKLVVVDDGTCEVNGYCTPSFDGIATYANNGYRVMSRIDENHIRVLVK